MAELPATGSLGTGQLDTRDLLVAGVPISISSKYLYLYLELSGSTIILYFNIDGKANPSCERTLVITGRTKMEWMSLCLAQTDDLIS